MAQAYRPRFGRDDVPELLVEPLRPAVERVRAVVRRYMTGLAVEHERAARDAVGEAADGRPEILPLGEVLGEAGMAEDDVGGNTARVGDDERLQRRAPRDDGCLDPVRVRQRHRRNLAAVGERPEAPHGQRRAMR